MIKKSELYKSIAAEVDCSVGFVQQVDYGYRSRGDKTKKVIAALEAARRMEAGIEEEVKRAIAEA
jgi:hypothetical protein